MGCGSSVNNQVQPNQNIPQVKVSLKITEDPKFFEPVTRTINTKKPEKQLYLVFFTLQKHYEMVPQQDKTLKDEQEFDFQLRQNEVITCQLCYEEQINQQEGQLKIVIGEGAFIIDQNQVRQVIETILFYEGKKTAQVNIEVNLISPLPQPQQQQGQNNDERKILFEAKSLKLINERLTNENILLLTIRYGDDTANMIKKLEADQNLIINFQEWTILQFTNKLTPIYLELWLQQKQGTDTFLGQAYFSIQGEQTMNLTNNGDIVGQITIFSNILKQSDIIINANQPVHNNEVNNQIRYRINQKDYIGSYSGSMVNDEYDGKGILTCGKTKYEGQFQKGKKSGQGKLLWNDKLYYDGRWGNNTFEGNGVWQFETETKRGVWVNGLRINWRDDEQNAIYSGRSVSAGYMLKSQNQLFTMHFSNEGYLYVIHNQTKQAVFAIPKSKKQSEKPYSLELDENGLLNFRGKKGIYYTENEKNKLISNNKRIESTLALFDDGRLVIQDTATLDIIWESQSLF